MNKKALFLSTFLVLWAIDTAATCRFVSVLGPDMEANPLIKWLIVNFGLWAFVYVKYAIACFWWYLHDRVHVSIHVALNLIMIPVAALGMIVAVSTF